MIPISELRDAIRFHFNPPKRIRRAKAGGLMYLRYSGAHLRRIRAVNGIGRPARMVLLWTRL